MITSSIKETLGFLQKHPQIFIIGALGGFISAVISIMTIGMIPTDPAKMMGLQTDPTEMMGSQLDPMAMLGDMAGPIILLSVIGYLLRVYLMAASYRFIKSKDVLGALTNAFAPALNILIANIVLLIVILALLVLTIIPLILVALVLPVLGILIAIVGLMVVIVCIGVYVYPKFIFAEFVITVGGLGPIEGIKRSFAHAKGYEITIFSTTLVFGLLMAVLIVPLYLILTIGGIIGSLLSTVISSTLSPAYYVLLAMMYLHIKKERQPPERPKTLQSQQPQAQQSPGQNLGAQTLPQSQLKKKSQHVKPITTTDPQNPNVKIQWPKGYQPD